MTRPNIFVELGNRNSEMVKDALTRDCKICGSKAGKLCTSMPINGKPYRQLVHFWRTEA